MRPPLTKYQARFSVSSLFGSFGFTNRSERWQNETDRRLILKVEVQATDVNCGLAVYRFWGAVAQEESQMVRILFLELMDFVCGLALEWEREPPDQLACLTLVKAIR